MLSTRIPKIWKLEKLSNYQIISFFLEYSFLERAEANKNIDNQIISRGTEESYARLRATDQKSRERSELEKYLSEGCLSWMLEILYIFFEFHYCIHVQFCLLHFILHTLICIFVNELWLFVIAFQSLKVFMKCFSVVCGSEKEIFVYSLRRHDRTGGSRNHTGSGFSFSQDFIFLLLLWLWFDQRRKRKKIFDSNFPILILYFQSSVLPWRRRMNFIWRIKCHFLRKDFAFSDSERCVDWIRRWVIDYQR